MAVAASWLVLTLLLLRPLLKKFAPKWVLCALWALAAVLVCIVLAVCFLTDPKAGEQDGDTANGAEPIEWLVLDRDSSRVLLISRYALDFRSYTSFYQPVEENACWKDCSLRGWLNDAFFNTAFTPEEQQKIVVTNTTIPYSDTFIPDGTEDRVFLLTKEDVRYYMTSTEDAQVTPTAYAHAQLPDYQTDAGATVTWWLRSDLNNHASVVLWDGRTNDSMRSYEPAYVRPVIWLAMNP